MTSLDYDASPVAFAVRTIHLQFVPRCIHRGVIDRKRYGITACYAGIRHTQKVLSRTEWTTAEQEIGEHQLILHPAERMISILKQIPYQRISQGFAHD